MSGTFGLVILASFLACIVTSIGIYSISHYEKWGNRNAVYFMSFAAGVLISVSFIHIIPKSFNMNGTAPVYLLVGFMGLYVFHRLINTMVCQDRENSDLSLGIIPMVGIGMHSFVDGVIYSVTFNVSIFTGVVAAIGIGASRISRRGSHLPPAETCRFFAKKISYLCVSGSCNLNPAGHNHFLPVYQQN